MCSLLSLTNKYITLLLLSLFLLSCSEKDPSFSLLSDSDQFQQSEGSVNSKIDILWVMDNSGSMETSQQNVIDNLNVFISDFQTKNLDFKMAVTTTDGYRTQFTGNQNCSRFRNRILNSSCNTVSGTPISPYRVLDALTPDLLQNFLINALQTDTARAIYGSGDERAFQSIKAAFDQPLNAGFLRPDSFLAIVVVSDEDDFSHDSSTNVETISGGAYLSNPWSYPGLHPISQYTNYLDTLTGTGTSNRRYNVNSMSIFDEPCRLLLTTPTFQRKIGYRHGELSDATDGIKSSLCGDFSVELALIADNILTLATQFYLNRIPIPSSIVVHVNGVLVPNRATNPLGNGGWEYDAVSNSIRFYGGNYIPPAGAVVNVDYDPAQYGS